jgi:tellurite resistance protein TerC
MSIAVWIGFLIFVVLMVMLDLGVFHRKAHKIGLKESLGWTLIWVAVALLFNVVVYFLYENNSSPGSANGWEAATQFFTGYVLEKSLSVDNIFVIAMIFAFFGVPLIHQHRLLFWGILGAVVMRGIMIGIGAALIERFSWITYVFGAMLLYSAVKILLVRHDQFSPDDHLLVRLVRRWFPIHSDVQSGRMFVTTNGRRAATPLFLALVLVESSDVMFAIDSIPAVFAVTRDPFLVFTSNIFAILGLRSLYFVLAGFMDKFRYLKMSLVFILAYVGVKMLLMHHYHIPNLVSLSIIAGILAVGILASLIDRRNETDEELPTPLPRTEAEVRL